MIRDYDDRPRQYVVIVRGTSSTNSVVSILDEISSKFNVKIVSAVSGSFWTCNLQNINHLSLVNKNGQTP